MNADIFGNLLDWGEVIEKLDRLKETRQLDSHQDGLARILRYRDNWRLRENVLNLIVHIAEPTNSLVQEVIHIAMDDDAYLDVRIQAVKALSHMISLCSNPDNTQLSYLAVKAVENMNKLLHSPQPPIFHESILKALRSETCGGHRH
jgi:hypothetical protein